MDQPNQIELTETDRAILNQIQSDFPIDARPYRELGRRLGLDEEEVLDRVRAMRQNGVIRRIGGNFAAAGMGYTSTLCAARVPPDKIDAFVDAVNRYPGVTHNYRRDHRLNLWFTFIAPSMDDIEHALDDISARTGVAPILNLPAVQTYKIKVDFKFEDPEDEDD
jgi:DNA-binding Lrp family transcriptional regulator